MNRYVNDEIEMKILIGFLFLSLIFSEMVWTFLFDFPKIFILFWVTL